MTLLIGGLLLLTGCNDKAEVSPAYNGDKLRVYPSPAVNYAHIEVRHLDNSPFVLKVFDPKGELMLDEQGIQGFKTFNLDLSGRPKGKYQVILKTDQLVSTQVLLKI